jgi:hypothetical protein
MVNRKLFIALYREALQIELKKAHTAYFSGNSKILMTKGMGDKREKEVYDEMRELQGKLSAKEIFSYHDFVLTLLRKEGESVVALRKASQICSIKNEKYCSLSSSTSTATASSTSSSSSSSYSSSHFHADMHPLPLPTTASTTAATSRSTTPTTPSTTTQRSSPVPVPIPPGTTKTITLPGTGAEKHKELYGSDVESEGLGSTSIPLNNQQTLCISFTVQVARLAVTVLEETAPSRSSNISRLYNTESIFQIDDARTTDNVRSVLSLVVYGTHVTVRTSGDDKDLSGRIGSVRTYGLSGVEMLSCGSDPHYWMNQGVITLGSGQWAGQGAGGEKGEDRQEFAAELTVRRGSAGALSSDGNSDSAEKGGSKIEHHDVASMSSSYTDNNINSSGSSSSGSSDERKEREREREKRRKNQTVIELSVYPLTATWDSQTLHLLRTLTDHLTRTLLNSSPLGHVTVLTAHEHALHRLKAASLSMLKTLGEVDYSHTR